MSRQLGRTAGRFLRVAPDSLHHKAPCGEGLLAQGLGCLAIVSDGYTELIVNALFTHP